MPDSRIDVREAVEWAARNYRKVVSRSDNGTASFDWSKAEEDPPPLGEEYLEHAAQNPTSFFKDTVPKFLGGGDEEDDAAIQQEKRSIQDIRAVLKRYKDAGKKER